MPDSASLLQCHRCGLTQQRPDGPFTVAITCCRCHAPLTHRRTHRPQVTLALALTAAVLFLPATLQPILNLTKMGYVTSETLVGGVLAVWDQGYWPLSLLILMASIIFPALKITLLILLGAWRPSPDSNPRAAMWRWKVAKAIDQWAMVDVFLLAIAVALIKLSALATVSFGPGLYALIAVVILLLLATMTFDPSCLWDERSSTS